MIILMVILMTILVKTVIVPFFIKVFIPLSQKDFLEQHIVKKRNAERDHQEYWSGTSKVRYKSVKP